MKLRDFSGIPLPDADASDSLMSAMRSNLVQVRGGVIDQDGGRVYPEVNQFGRQAWFIDNLDNNIDQLRQRQRKGAGILRATMRDNVVRMTLAKLTQLTTNADVNTYDCYQPYTVRFQQTYPYWMDERDGRFLDSGDLLDTGLSMDWQGVTASISASPTRFTVFNGGNAPVPMLFIHVVCGATATLSDFTLYNDTNGQAFRYSTALGNNQRLIIDTLGRAVTNNSANAYNGFSLPDNSQTNWMQLEPGNNAIRLTYVSKTNTPTITFYFLRHFV